MASLSLSRKLLCLIVIAAVVSKATSTDLPGTLPDISDVVFANSSDTSNSCTADYPDIELSDITSTTVTVKWEPIPDESNITKYEVMFWEYSTSLYISEMSLIDRPDLDHRTFTVTTLDPFTKYFLSVRAVCRGDVYGVAASRMDFLTRSTLPSGKVTMLPVDTDNISFAVISWNELPSDQWNGLKEHYVVTVADVTPGFGYQLTQLVPADETTLIVHDVMPDHSYIATVSALSSGGLGEPSDPSYFTVELPPTPTSGESEGQKISDIWYYLAVPAGVILAMCGTVIVIVCKVNYDKKKKKYVYARDITTNIDEQKFMVGSDFDRAQRMDPTRMSNRPLPAHPAESPHPRTPSVSSMSARLIDQTSPNQFVHHGMSFSSADQHHFHHHHQSQSHHPAMSQPQYPGPPHHPPGQHPPDLLPLELDPVHHQFRNPSVSSPQIPQLSQPLSDLSSATPSSVFTESNVPHMEDNLSSPNTPKAYEVPSDSKTCHQSGGSPVMSHNTLPNPRRPHTATGVMASQPVLSRHPQTSHSPVSFTHSSSDIRNNHPVSIRPPDVPPHKANSFSQQQQRSVIHHSNQQPQHMITRPESGLYSEVPNDTSGNIEYPKITPPADSTLGLSTGLPPMISDGSVISSDQYSDYSDIPGACGSPPPPPPLEGRQKLPSLEEEYRNNNRLSSESMSSFSSDSRSSSPAHSKVSDVNIQLSKMPPLSSGRPGPGLVSHIPIPEEHDYDECNSVITDNSSSLNSKIVSKPNPYLSPVDIVAPSNGHSPSD